MLHVACEEESQCPKTCQGGGWGIGQPCLPGHRVMSGALGGTSMGADASFQHPACCAGASPHPPCLTGFAHWKHAFSSSFCFFYLQSASASPKMSGQVSQIWVGERRKGRKRDSSPFLAVWGYMHSCCSKSLGTYRLPRRVQVFPWTDQREAEATGEPTADPLSPVLHPPTPLSLC